MQNHDTPTSRLFGATAYACARSPDVADQAQVEFTPTILAATLNVRSLKIEAHGDGWRGTIKPKIRLMGKWLERIGFTPGERVQVTCLGLGVIELRATAIPPRPLCQQTLPFPNP
jgi:hypothetical protein